MIDTNFFIAIIVVIVVQMIVKEKEYKKLLASLFFFILVVNVYANKNIRMEYFFVSIVIYSLYAGYVFYVSERDKGIKKYSVVIFVYVILFVVVWLLFYDDAIV